MTVKPTNQGWPQAGDFAVETALPVTGNASRQDGQTVLTSMDTLFGNILEDRNARFVGGGAISFDAGGTTLTFGERLDFTYNNAGTQETVTSVVAASGTITFTANSNMSYIVLTKGSPGSVVLTNNATALPAATSQQEVFLVAVRRDDISGTKRVYLYNQLSIDAGQTLPSGVPSVSNFTDAAFEIVNSTDATKVLNTSVSGSSTSTTTTLATSSTANHTLTLPNTTDTLTANAATQTLSNKDLTASTNTYRTASPTVNGATTSYFPTVQSSVKSTAIDYTITTTDGFQVVLADATSGTRTIVFPSASANSGRIIEVKKIDSSANAVQPTRSGSDTFDNAATTVNISSQYDSATFISDGVSNWSQLVRFVRSTTGTGSEVFSTSPSLTTPNLGTPSAVTLTHGTGLPANGGLTGQVPIANGGTGQATQQAGFDALSPNSSSGDTIYYNGTHNVSLPIGIAGHTYMVNSAGTLPVWNARQVIVSSKFTSGSLGTTGSFLNFSTPVKLQASDFTAQCSGRYKVTASGVFVNASASNNGFQIASSGASTPSVLVQPVATFASTASGPRTPITVWGIFTLTAGSAYNFNLLAQIDNGTLTIDSLYSGGVYLELEQIE